MEKIVIVSMVIFLIVMVVLSELDLKRHDKRIEKQKQKLREEIKGLGEASKNYTVAVRDMVELLKKQRL